MRNPRPALLRRVHAACVAAGGNEARDGTEVNPLTRDLAPRVTAAGVAPAVSVVCMPLIRSCPNDVAMSAAAASASMTPPTARWYCNASWDMEALPVLAAAAVFRSGRGWTRERACQAAAGCMAKVLVVG